MIEKNSPAELIKEKFKSFKNNDFGLYFFLYFFHLMGYFTYKEENGKCTFSNEKQSFKVNLPLADSSEKFEELQKIHEELEILFVELKSFDQIQISDLNILDEI